MRVLMTADTIGGVWTYALDLAAGMAVRGVETTLVTMGRPLTPDQWAAAQAVPGLKIIETSYRLEWMQDAWEDVDAAGRLLLDIAADLQPQVIHLNGFAHASLDWSVTRAPVLVVGHSCVETWWRAVKGVPTGPEWATYRERVRRGIHDADAFVAPTRAMLDAFHEVYGHHASPVVIHNGRDAARFRPADKQPFVLSAGRLWDQAKNITLLERAAEAIRWPVRVAGEERSPQGGPARKLHMQSLGLLQPAELARCMSHASIYALPARYEPFGLSAVEAALSGCALVLGDIPTLREVWGDDALFVSPDHADRLADAMNALIADPARRAALADRARRRATRLSTSRMALAYLSLYGRLCAASRRPATVHSASNPPRTRAQEVAA